MAVDFYVDIIGTFLLNVFEVVACCGKSKNYTDRLKWKKRKVMIRMTLGFIFKLAGFITVCWLNSETDTYGKDNVAMFRFNVSFFVISFAAIVITVWICLIFSPISHNEDIDMLNYMIMYRLYEIIFKGLVFVYSQVSSNWEMNELKTAGTVVSCFDLALNIMRFGRDCYDLLRIDKDPRVKRMVVCYVFFVVLLGPSLSISLMLNALYFVYEDIRDKRIKRDV